MRTLTVRLLLVLFCTIVFGGQTAFAQPGGGPPPPALDSSVKITSWSSANLGGGNYRLTVKGQTTLGKDHEWDSFTISFNDILTVGEDNPTIHLVDHPEPDPGKTTEFEYYIETHVNVGTMQSWMVVGIMHFKNEKKEKKDAKDVSKNPINLP